MIKLNTFFGTWIFFPVADFENLKIFSVKVDLEKVKVILYRVNIKAVLAKTRFKFFFFNPLKHYIYN